jgi:hypothetical protein
MWTSSSSFVLHGRLEEQSEQRDYPRSVRRQRQIQPAPRFAGTPGKANCYGQSVSALVRQYRGLNAAAEALGFSNVKALQNAILAYCGG